MTNTGDFRRYSYSRDAAYALESFNLTRSSAAPKREPKADKGFKVRENRGRKSTAVLIREEKLNSRRAALIVTSAVLVIAMMFCAIGSMAHKNELIHEIARYEHQLAIAQSENTRINSELDALVSMSQIDKYAVEELGMTKMQPNQIRYIDVTAYEENYAIGLQALEAAE